MPEPDTRQNELGQALRRCSPETISAVDRYFENHRAEDAVLVVHGVLSRGENAEHGKTMATLGGAARLIEDLGHDSLELLEAIMTLEIVFKIELASERLYEVRTLADLERFIQTEIRQNAPEKADG